MEAPEQPVRQGAANPGGSGSGKNGAGDGSPAPTIANSRGILVPARPGLNGGTLASGGNKGMPNPNAGRPAERVRKRATESYEEAVPRFERGMAILLDKAFELMDSGRTHDAIAAFKQAHAIHAGMGSIGIGTKVTNVVERDGFIDRACDAFDQVVSDPELRARFVDSLTDALKE